MSTKRNLCAEIIKGTTRWAIKRELFANRPKKKKLWLMKEEK